jgi:hypothetical protein
LGRSSWCANKLLHNLQRPNQSREKKSSRGSR